MTLVVATTSKIFLLHKPLLLLGHVCVLKRTSGAHPVHLAVPLCDFMCLSMSERIPDVRMHEALSTLKSSITGPQHFTTGKAGVIATQSLLSRS